MTTPISKTTQHILGRVQQLLDVKNDKSRKAITLFAIGIFVVGLIVSSQRLDSSINWNVSGLMLGSMLVLLILTYLVNSLRSFTHSKIVGARLSFADNAKMSLFGSAMNMLPLIIPAGMVMRMSNFVQHGGETKTVIGVLMVNYLLALVSSLLLGIAMLTRNGFEQLQIALLLTGVIYVASLVIFIRMSGIRNGISIAVLEFAGVGIDAVRIFLCFSMLGFSIETFQAAILTVSAILGSAVSIVPAGLGVRELVGALISPLISVVPAQTFLAIALNRIFGMLFFVGLSALVLFTDRRKS